MQKATGNVVRRYREHMGLNQDEVGFLVYGIPRNRRNAAQQRVKTIEAGKQALRVTDLSNYAALFKIKPHDLLKEILKEYNRM